MNARCLAAVPALLAAAALLAGTAEAQSPAAYSPRAATPGGSNSNNSYPFGQRQMEYQQVHTSWSFSRPGPLTVNGLRMTPDLVTQPTTVDLELWMAKSPHGVSGIQNSFAANEIAATRVKVVNRRMVSLPATQGNWDFSLPFDRPFAWDGGHLAWRVKQFGNGAGSSVRYAFEAHEAATSSTQTGSFAGCTGTGGIATAHSGLLRAPGSRFGSRLLAQSGLAHQPVPAVVNFGLSATSFQGTALPIDLGPIGMNGCMLTQDVLMSMPTNAPSNAYGSFQVPLTLPDQTGLAGSVFHTQVAFLQPGANRLGVFLSPGATHTVPRKNGVARIYGGLNSSFPTVEPNFALVIGLVGR